MVRSTEILGKWPCCLKYPEKVGETCQPEVWDRTSTESRVQVVIREHLLGKGSVKVTLSRPQMSHSEPEAPVKSWSLPIGLCEA